MRSKKGKRGIASTLFYSTPVMHTVAWFARLIVGVLLKTIRLRIEGKEHLQPLVEAINRDPQTAKPVTIALWHNQLLLVPLLRKCAPIQSCVAVVSGSRDGKLLASFIKTYPEAETILVGHKSRSQALQEMIETLIQRKILLITPDGPRGPRHQVKMGTIYSAIKSDALIVPLRWSASKCLELHTWDGMRIPYPFSKVTLTIGPPLHCQSGSPEALAKELATQLSIL